MKKIVIYIGAFLVIMASCNKAETPSNENFEGLTKDVLTDFPAYVAIPQYGDLYVKATELETAVQQLIANPTNDKLNSTRQAWRDMRSIWEKSEGYLFGPVEDNEYDPQMDTWPVDYVQMDSLLASSNPLEVSDIQSLSTLSLRGFHPIEYVLWGKDGNRSAATITDREKQYIQSLATDLKNICKSLSDSWNPSGGNFAQNLVNAGQPGSVYATKLEAYMAITEAMIGICEEVGEGKMEEPYAALDSAIVESPFSGNSVTDFRNNIIGLQNVYLGKWTSDGKGMNEVVNSKNINLDNNIQQKIAAAISSFDAISLPYEQAIFDQRTQIKNTQNALADLADMLNNDLKPFLVQNIKD